MKKSKLIKELKKSEEVATIARQHSEYLKAKLAEALNLIDVKKDKETWFRKMLKDIKSVAEERSKRIALLENESDGLRVSRAMLRDAIEGFKNDNTRLTLELRKKQEAIDTYSATTAEFIKENEELKKENKKLRQEVRKVVMDALDCHVLKEVHRKLINAINFPLFASSRHRLKAIKEILK